jgi:hypothetical protein
VRNETGAGRDNQDDPTDTITGAVMRAAAPVLALAAVLLVLAGCSSAPVAASTDSCTGSGCAATLAPTQQAAATTAPAAPDVPVQNFSGSGSDVVNLTTPVQFGILKFSCPKCSGNIIVKTDAEIDPDLVNRTGRYTGTRWIGARGDTTSRVQITAKGAWTLTVGGLGLAAQHDVNDAVTGQGDDVLFYRVLPQTVVASHKGTSNFIVQEAMDGLNPPDLSINEIGSYSGTVMFPGDGSNAGLVQVTADGAWSLTPKS